jgi:hypothetical protein
MMNKTEMEQAWQTGPIDVLKSYCKSRKRLKPYSLTIEPLQYSSLGKEDVTVFAKNMNDAKMKAKDLMYDKHKGKRIDSYRINFRSL